MLTADGTAGPYPFKPSALKPGLCDLEWLRVVLFIFRTLDAARAASCGILAE